jgi:hypothetical protein
MRTVEPRALRTRAAAAAVLLVPVVVIAASFWPGHMSGDTLAQIDQVISGDYTNQHAPILMAIWHPFYEAGFGPGWVLTLQLLAFMAACYLILRAAFEPLGAAIVATLIALSPPVFGMLGYLSRDIWFTALLLLAFGLVVRASQREGRERLVWLGLAVGVSWLCLAARQNAAPAIVLALVMGVGVWMAARSSRPGRIRGAVVALVAGFAITVGLMGTQVAAQAAIGVRDVNPEQYLFLYDVLAVSHEEDENLFPPDVMPQRGTQVIDTYWNVDAVNPLIFSPDPPVKTPLSESQVESITDEWRDLVTGHPLDYLDERIDLWLRQLAITRKANFIYHPVIDGNPFGFHVRFPELNQEAKEYVEWFAVVPSLDGGIVHAVWIYMLLCLAAAVVFLRRGRPAALVCIGALGLSSLTFQVGLFLGAMGTQYRFQISVVVAGLLCAAIMLRFAYANRRGKTV